MAIPVRGSGALTRARTSAVALGGARFDYGMAFLGTWLTGGAYLDAWAHNHGKVDNTFFTPWHAVLYSGFAASALVLFAVVLLNRQRGLAWRAAIPVGYTLPLVGSFLFPIGGAGDLIWHTLFGFEVGVEPLLSPTHLVLAASAVFVVIGPVRAAWLRAAPARGWAALFPAVLALTNVYSVLTFFTMYAHPFVSRWAGTRLDGDAGQSLGVASVLLQSALLMGFVLFALRRWELPAGTLTLLLTLNAVYLSFQHDYFDVILVGLLAGVIGDALLVALRPSAERVASLRTFAFALPAALYLLYFIAVELHPTIMWSIHLWLGSVALAGVIGLLISYLIAPPAVSEHAATK
jgi:hypothetical protein